ncbi:hypothetical protein DPMN_154887 [Dreissena polymorpha]|uniref:Uncharacterized protein n=2 Tax=Dreissena polymorpha TaxID=45954 RepID=A0A9D4FRP9_DREPO|nr:hypothetical protein DPMN_154887 [Dreissena polymorpha]
MELANDQLKHFLSTMKTFLMLSFFQDYKDEVDCQLDKLSKLENDEFEVSIENEIAARKDALDGMQELIADIQGNYSQMKDQLEEINKRTADQCSDNREIKQHLSAQTKNIELIHETQESMSESMSHLQTNIRESSEKTDKILASNGLILARMEQLYELLTKQNPDLKETLQTDIVTKINVKPTNAEAGDTVSEEMCTAGIEIINSFNGDSADDPLKHGLKDVVGKLQEGNNKVTGFKQKCLEIYVSSPTIKSWVTLNKAFFDGTIEKAFLPLQTYLRTRHGCSNLTLTIELDQECFNKCANTIISTLNRMFNNQQTEVHPNKVMENERKEETHKTAQAGDCSEVIYDTVTKTPVVNMEVTTLCDEMQAIVKKPLIASCEETRGK